MRTRTVAVATLVVVSGCAGLVPTTPEHTGVRVTATPTAAGIGEAGGQSWNVTVVEVIDGDTMEVAYRNGSRETVRLVGVDAPETYTAVSPDEWAGVPDTASGRRWLRGWGENASAFAQRRLAGQTVRIVTDPAAGRRGGYGRLLVYVVSDDEVFGEQLLAEGYARLYETEFALYDRFSAAEAQAMAADRGVWGFEPN